MKKKFIKTIYWFIDRFDKKAILKYFPGIYRLGVLIRWRSFIKSGDTVVQAGVDMGTKHKKCLASNVFYMSKIVGKEGKVIAIEPDKNNIKKLKEYIKENHIENIIPVEKALWKERGKFTFLIAKNSWDNQLSIIPDTDKIPKDTWIRKRVVQADTLDNILENLGIDSISHICLTINGAELEVLEGMKKTLQNKITMLVASGDSQRYRPTANGVPLNKKIASVLEDHGFKTKINRKGWINAYK